MSQAVVGKWRNNLAIRVPFEIARASGPSDGERVEIETLDGDILIHCPAAPPPGRAGAARRKRRRRDHWREQTLFAGRSLNARPPPGRPPRVSIVVDASMTIAWHFADERTDAAHAVMLRVGTGGGSFHRCGAWKSPTCSEMLFVAGAATTPMSIARWNGSRFPVDVDNETSTHAWTATRALSREQGLTSYEGRGAVGLALQGL